MRSFVLRRRAPGSTGALLTIVMFVLCAASAHAASPPAFTTAPELTGEPLVGAPVEVTAQWSGDPAPTAFYQWSRCTRNGRTCDVIPGACSPTYVVVVADVGQRLVARVDLFSSAGRASAQTPQSAQVGRAAMVPLAAGDAAQTPPPGGDPCTSGFPPSPPPAPAPSPAPATPPAPPPVQAAPGPARLAYLAPFPTVRIRGYSVPGGIRVNLLSVRGARPARIRLVCVGAGCPPRAQIPKPMPAPARVRAFERFFPFGTFIVVRVTAPRAIGKYTSFKVRPRRSPKRVDRCLVPGRWDPVDCPPA